MNLALMGYGQMGKQVEEIASGRNHTIIARVDPLVGDTGTLDRRLAEKSDGIIEFSLPDAVLSNVKLYGELGINAVVGTTGWYDRIDEVKDIVRKSGIGFLYGSNFSIGAHLFFRLTAKAAQLINPVPEYDILGFELHHKMKKDSPSGTAHTLAKIIMENCKRKSSLVTEKLDRPIRENELHFASVRGGAIPGIHKVILDSDADTIELTHTARNRKGFALGAVLAMEWLKGKKGFYGVEEFIDGILQG